MMMGQMEFLVLWRIVQQNESIRSSSAFLHRTDKLVVRDLLGEDIYSNYENPKYYISNYWVIFNEKHSLRHYLIMNQEEWFQFMHYKINSLLEIKGLVQ